MEELKCCCETCKFWEATETGKHVCKDYEGLYFQWVRKPEGCCPDYVNRKNLEMEKV